MQTYVKKKKGLTEKESFVYFFQICLGIDYLHKCGYIHRDINSYNILIDVDGNSKISNFRLITDFSTFNLRKTVCGIHEYSAPEMLN